jgi:hypothetical protein
LPARLDREKIAAILGIAPMTLEKHFGDTLDHYQKRMLSKVAVKA